MSYVAAARALRAPTVVEMVAVAFISVACGLSAFFYGFYDLSTWAPIGLGILAALLGLLLARRASPARPALVAAGALTGMWLWALASTQWSESAAQAMTLSNRWLLYASLFALLILLVRDDRVGVVMLAAGTAAIAALAGYLLIRLVAGTGSELFRGGRLDGPLGYANGQVGYLALGLWPLVAVAERARSHLLAGVGVALATALGSIALLGQTRALLPAVMLSALLMLLAVPGRLRRAWALVFVAAGVLASLRPVLEVYDSARGAGEPSEVVLRHAGLSIALAAAATGIAWAVAARAVEGLRARAGDLKASRALGWAPIATIVLIGVAAAASQVERPIERAKDEYVAFTQLRGGSDGLSRFTSTGGNRHDYWRVAWRQVSGKPLHGVGAGNYDTTYFLDRRTPEYVRQAHSIQFQTLGELGLVGGGLLTLFLAAVGWGFARRARAARSEPGQAALAVAAGGVFVVWLVQTSVDWLHLIPGLTGIGLCSAAVLMGPWARPRGHQWRRTRATVVCAVGVAVVVGAVLLARESLAERYREQGQSSLAGDPGFALERARKSLALNDEALQGYYLESAAWARLGNYGKARAALREATRREPHDFVPWALLGDLAARRGDRRLAVRNYRTASRLNPQDPAIAAAAQHPPRPRRG